MLLPSKIFLQENKCPNDVFVILLQLECESSIQVCNKTINCSCLHKSKYSRSKWPLKVDRLTKLIEEDVASCVNKWFDLLCHGLVPLPIFPGLTTPLCPRQTIWDLEKLSKASMIAFTNKARPLAHLMILIKTIIGKPNGKQHSIKHNVNILWLNIVWGM